MPWVVPAANKEVRAMKRGFTLIELLLVMAIMGILMAIALSCHSHFVDKVRGLF